MEIKLDFCKYNTSNLFSLLSPQALPFKIRLTEWVAVTIMYLIRDIYSDAHVQEKTLKALLLTPNYFYFR